MRKIGKKKKIVQQGGDGKSAAEIPATATNAKKKKKPVRKY